ncbi:MAG: hypothetical protein L6Q68_06770 [Aquabacterium sp.]|nr:hypothetical protein [Aquabacterium sp.]
MTKKLSPSSRGALKLAREFGDALVCVRYRTDAKGLYRYTTVELLVDKTEIQPRTDTRRRLLLRSASPRESR